MNSQSIIYEILFDDYVAGFMAGKFTGNSAYCSIELGLPKEDVMEVMAQAMLSVYGNLEAFQLVNNHNTDLRSEQNPEFRDGYQKATKLASYALQREDITADPDFIDALKAAKEAGVPASNDMAFPLSGLEQLWFVNHVKGHAL